MVADLMARFGNFLSLIPMRFYFPPRQKERGFNVMLF